MCHISRLQLWVEMPFFDWKKQLAQWLDHFVYCNHEMCRSIKQCQCQNSENTFSLLQSCNCDTQNSSTQHPTTNTNSLFTFTVCSAYFQIKLVSSYYGKNLQIKNNWNLLKRKLCVSIRSQYCDYIYLEECFLIKWLLCYIFSILCFLLSLLYIIHFDIWTPEGGNTSTFN